MVESIKNINNNKNFIMLKIGNFKNDIINMVNDEEHKIKIND